MVSVIDSTPSDGETNEFGYSRIIGGRLYTGNKFIDQKLINITVQSFSKGKYIFTDVGGNQTSPMSIKKYLKEFLIDSETVNRDINDILKKSSR